MSYHNVYEASCYEPTRENKKIYGAILERIKELNPSSVLEIGSGIGMLGDGISNQGIRYVGIEPDDVQINLCRERYPNLNVVQGSCYERPEKYALGEFDMVFSTDVIEHLYLPRHLISFKTALVKKGGFILTCTPEFGSYWKNLLYSITNKWDQVHSPLWDGGHIKFFSQKSMKTILEEHGLIDFQWSTITNVNIPILPMSMLCVCKKN